MTESEKYIRMARFGKFMGSMFLVLGLCVIFALNIYWMLNAHLTSIQMFIEHLPLYAVAVSFVFIGAAVMGIVNEN